MMDRRAFLGAVAVLAAPRVAMGRRQVSDTASRRLCLEPGRV
jgi:hypothetical protein